MQAALMFEVLMYLNSYYFGMFTIWEVITYFIKMGFKGEELYYNPDYTSRVMLEISIFSLFCFFETGRIYFGRKHDSCDKPMFIVFSLFLAVPSSGAILYLLSAQVHTVRLEKMLCSFQLLMEACELFFGLIHLITHRTDKF